MHLIIFFYYIENRSLDILLNICFCIPLKKVIQVWEVFPNWLLFFPTKVLRKHLYLLVFMTHSLNSRMSRCLFDVAIHNFRRVVGCCHIERMCGNVYELKRDCVMNQCCTISHSCKTVALAGRKSEC